MRIGSLWIHPYTLRLSLGVLLGAAWLIWRAPRWGVSRAAIPALLWMLLASTLLLGRLGYVLGNPLYFSQNPGAILALGRVGGLYGGSAFVGGLLAAMWFVRRVHLPLARLLTWLTPAVLLTAAGAWWGCAAAGCAWGQDAVTPVWLIAETRDLYGLLASRYATATLGMGWALLMVGAAVALGRCGGAALALYWVGEAALTTLRADPVPLWGAYRVDTLLSLTLAACLWCVFWIGRPQRVASRNHPMSLS